jgi:hypothetical protein
VFAIASILMLFLVGLMVALQSGNVDRSRPLGTRRLLGNLSSVLIRVFGYLAGFWVVQQIMGVPTQLGW